jgi:hypothetical protein
MPFPTEADIARTLADAVRLLSQCNRGDLPLMALTIHEANRLRVEIDTELCSRAEWDSKRRQEEREKVGKYFRRHVHDFLSDTNSSTYKAVTDISREGYATGWSFCHTASGRISFSATSLDANGSSVFGGVGDEISAAQFWNAADEAYGALGILGSGVRPT